MIKFSYKYDESSPLIEFTLPPDSTVSDLLEQFGLFMKAAGYVFDGTLEITEEPHE